MVNYKFVLVLLLSTCILSCNDKVPKQPKAHLPNVVMHRGLHLFKTLAPENSLDGIALAGRVGAKFVEIDLSVTKDGEIILLHDHIVNKNYRNVTDYSIIEGEVACKSSTLNELRSKYVLEAENPSMRRPVPTLEEALILCRQYGIYPYIEFKEYTFTKEDIKKAYNIATGILGKGNYSFTSFEGWILEYLRDMDSDVGLYCDYIQDTDYLLKHKINYYPNYEAINEANVAAMHKAGLLASTWTVPKESFDSIVTKGFDGILSDDIAPAFDKDYAIFYDNSNYHFSNYEINGSLNNNVVLLANRQTLELKEVVRDSLYLGGLYFTVEAKGKFKIEANGFQVERENLYDDYKMYRFQYLFHNEKPFFRITALNDNVMIKSVWLAINDY